jgi:toxin YoeB
MPYRLTFRTEAHEDLEELRKGSKQDYIKCFDLVRAILLEPRFGIGKPERLKHILDNVEIYSRRINEKDRIVYTIYEENEMIEVMSCIGHYSDR